MKKGWLAKKIGDVCSLMTGGTPSKAMSEYFGGEIKWLVSGDIHQGKIFDCEGRITEAGMKNSNAKLLPVNSVMIALNGQGKTRGTVALLRTQATCNQSLVSICPKEVDKLLPEFLYVNLNGRYQEIRQMTGDSGNDRRGLNMILIKNIEIPLPPLPIQKRIVGILEEVFDGIATAQANAAKNLQNARALFEAAFGVIVRQTDGNAWQQVSVTDVALTGKGAIRTGPFGSQLLHSEFVEEGTAVLGIDNAVNNEFRWGKKRFITREKFKQLARYQVYPGDVLITIMGTCGRCAIVPEDIPVAINTKHLCCITLDQNKCLPGFLHLYFLYHPVAQEFLSRRAKGAIMSGLNMGIIKELPLLLPPLDLQASIVDTLGSLREEAQRLEAIYQKKLAALEELKKSLLHQAFTGEL
jgi:type I restriction enzyme, S subunit